MEALAGSHAVATSLAYEHDTNLSVIVSAALLALEKMSQKKRFELVAHVEKSDR